MQSAPFPFNEAQRLRLLERLRILDTEQEQAFDDLVRMAADWCGVPIALVSLVDEHRQWFKARVGLEAQQTGRDESFCAHVVASGDALVVGDALKDERFHDNPLVTGEPKIRFYAGMPLTMSDGEVLGTLCIIDREPRELMAEQREALLRLSRQASALLQARGVAAELRLRAHALIQRERLLNLALKTAGEALWDWDVERGEINLAIGHGALLGYGAEDPKMESPDWTALMHPDDRAPTWEKIRDHVKGLTPSYEADYRLQHRNGSWVWVRSRGEVVERSSDGRALRMVGTVADIALRKSLEHRVAELNLQLEAEANKAHALASTKARFLATMAHEIRTPLNSIVGASRLALEDPDGAQQRDNLVLVHEASMQLARLVDGILDFSRLEAQGVQLEFLGVNIDGLLRRLQELFRVQAEVKNLSFRCEASPELPRIVRGDLMRLEQILCNLLGNAFKFTEQGSVKLDVCLAPASSEPCILFKVSDTGIGLKREQLASLFQPYAQADDSIARQFGGTGLGLVISRQLARLMGGDVTLESEAGHGTCATLNLPLMRMDLHAQASAEPPGPAAVETLIAEDLRGLRVLVVDDNLMNLKVLERSLTRAGMLVSVASSAARGLAALSQSGSDVVLMDLFMPEMNGAEATRIIRSVPELSGLPVLAVSASVTPQERDECRAAGMDGFVCKPVRLENLLSEIRRVVASRPFRRAS